MKEIYMQAGDNKANEHDGANPYHWFDLPDGDVVRGFWDLRQTWQEYLGSFNFENKTVLELGPASGFLGFKMEQAGAVVTAFDIRDGETPEIHPGPNIKIDDVKQYQTNIIKQFHRTWRFYHQRFQSQNRIEYGDIYDLSSLGRRFQVTTLSSILLHLSHPFRALEQAASVTDQTIIVTEMLNLAVENGALMEFCPNPNGTDGTGWWLLSPGAVSRMLTILGFTKQTLTKHTQRLYSKPYEETFTDYRFFTVVASRN